MVHTTGFIVFKQVFEKQTLCPFHALNDDLMSHIYSYIVDDNIESINLYYDENVRERSISNIQTKRIKMNRERFMKSFYSCIYTKYSFQKNEYVIPYLMKDISYFNQSKDDLDKTMRQFIETHGLFRTLLIYIAIAEYIEQDQYFMIYYHNKGNSLCKLIHHYLNSPC